MLTLLVMVFASQHLSSFTSTWLSTYLPIYLPTYLNTHLAINLTVSLPVYPSTSHYDFLTISFSPQRESQFCYLESYRSRVTKHDERIKKKHVDKWAASFISTTFSIYRRISLTLSPPFIHDEVSVTRQERKNENTTIDLCHDPSLARPILAPSPWLVPIGPSVGWGTHICSQLLSCSYLSSLAFIF